LEYAIVWLVDQIGRLVRGEVHKLDGKPEPVSY
jgi:hypothetical protein